MDEATKEFLKGIDSQFHNDRIDADTGRKMIEHMKTSPFYHEGDSIKHYEQELDKSREIYKSTLESINDELSLNHRRDAKIYDSIMSLGISDTSQLELSKILEIEKQNLEVIEARITYAEACDDQELIEQLTSDKAKIENSIATIQSTILKK